MSLRAAVETFRSVVTRRVLADYIGGRQKGPELLGALSNVDVAENMCYRDGFGERARYVVDFTHELLTGVRRDVRRNYFTRAGAKDGLTIALTKTTTPVVFARHRQDVDGRFSKTGRLLNALGLITLPEVDPTDERLNGVGVKVDTSEPIRFKPGISELKIFG